MIRYKRSIIGFLRGARQLFYGVEENNFIRERILQFNYDDTRISESIELFKQAEKAEKNKSKELGEQLGSKARYEKLMDETGSLCRKHIAFLKLLLRDDTDKQRKLFLVGIPRTRREGEWLKHMDGMYHTILLDDAVTASAGKYNISRADLEAAQVKVQDTIKAKDIHDRDKGAAELATAERDEIFDELEKAVEELTVICTYSLEDKTQMLETLGIRVYTPGYKPRRRKKKGTDDIPVEIPVPVDEEPQPEIMEAQPPIPYQGE